MDTYIHDHATPFRILAVIGGLLVIAGQVLNNRFKPTDSMPNNLEMIWQVKASNRRKARIQWVGNAMTYLGALIAMPALWS